MGWSSRSVSYSGGCGCQNSQRHKAAKHKMACSGRKAVWAAVTLMGVHPPAPLPIPATIRLPPTRSSPHTLPYPNCAGGGAHPPTCPPAPTCPSAPHLALRRSCQALVIHPPAQLTQQVTDSRLGQLTPSSVQQARHADLLGGRGLLLTATTLQLQQDRALGSACRSGEVRGGLLSWLTDWLGEHVHVCGDCVCACVRACVCV